jgi:conjugal transfer ATP-binding protein TraC
MGLLELPSRLARGARALIGSNGALAADAREREFPDALRRAGRRRTAPAFSEQLPYATWRASEAVFYLEGAHPGSVDGIGFVLELCPQTGATEQMAAILGTLFAACPKGAGLQISLFGTNQLDDHLAAYEALRPDTGLFRKFAVRRTDFYRAGARGALFASRPYQLRHVRIALSVVLPCSDLGDTGRLDQLLALREAMTATLRSVYLFGHVWDADALVNWCALLLNPQETIHGRPPRLRYDPEAELRHQMIAADTLHRVSPEGLVFGLPALGNETVVKAFSVRSYPASYALHGMAALLGDAFQPNLGLPCPFLITLGVRALDHDATRHAVTLRSARATQNAASQMARFQPDLADRKRDWDLAQRAFDAGGSLVQLYHQVLVFAPRAGHARAEHAVRAVWRARGFELMPDTYMQIQALLASLPMSLSPALQHDIAQARRFSTKTLANAVNLAPLLGEWTGHGAPVIPLFGRRGQAMGIDLFSNTAGNYNAAVVGTSGSGKSSFMNEIALSYLSTGARVWIIDVGRSYQKLCHTVGGAFIEFGEAGRFSLNPFALVEDIDADMEMLRPVVAQMVSPNAPLDPFQLAWLDIAIRAVWYEHGREATLTQLAEHLKTACRDEDDRCDPRVRDMGVQLFPFTADGAYGRFFAGGPPLDFDRDFIVLELEELKAKKDLQAVVLLMLMYRITREMYLTRERRKLVIVDEAWELLRGVTTGEFLEAGYRRARKYNGAFITGTQSIEDYTKSPAANAALENADWVFMLRQKPESLAALEASQRLPLNESMRAMLRSLQTEHGSFAEVFVYCPMGYGVGLVIFDPFTLLLASSRAEDMLAVDGWRRRGLSTEDAIERVLAERRAAGDRGARAE